MYVHGSVELLVLLHRKNLNPYPFLNQGIDVYAAARRSCTVEDLIDEMKNERPRLVALSRLKSVGSRDLLEDWVARDYDKLESYEASDVYVRRQK